MLLPSAYGFLRYAQRLRNAIDMTPRVTGGNGKPPADDNGHD
jgi:hypothetical protein